MSTVGRTQIKKHTSLPGCIYKWRFTAALRYNGTKVSNLIREAPMPQPMLTTKLFIPRSAARLIPREALVSRWLKGLRSGCRVTLICAPAGYGKATLMLELLKALESGTRLGHQFVATLVMMNYSSCLHIPGHACIHKMHLSIL
jgi:hypothetical protein